MIFGTNAEKIMELFLKEPLKDFHLRELERLSKIGLPSVRKYVSQFLKSKLVKREKYKVYMVYSANRDNRNFKLLKRHHLLINLAPALDKLKGIYPGAVVLFGSASKGEDTEKSDVDLFVQAKNKSFDFRKVEKKIKRKINLLFEEDTSKLNRDIFESIVNGVVLEGHLGIK